MGPVDKVLAAAALRGLALAETGVDRKGRRTFSYNCPGEGHAHGDRHASGILAIEDDGSSDPHCWVCGPREGRRAFLEHVEIEERELYSEGDHGRAALRRDKANNYARSRPELLDHRQEAALTDKPALLLASAPDWLALLDRERGVAEEIARLYKIGLTDRWRGRLGDVWLTIPIMSWRAGEERRPISFIGFRSRSMRPEGERGVDVVPGWERWPLACLDPAVWPGDGTVVVTEGEADALTARSAGLAAYGAPGAGSWSDAFAAELVDYGARRAVILGDRDEAGQRFNVAVVGSLRRHGIATATPELPDLGPTTDVTDIVVKRGHVELRAIVAACKFENRREAGGEREIVTTPASAISIETARFLDPERKIPANATTVLAGPPGLGKTTFATRTAARVSVGAAGYRPGAVLIISAEDSPATTLVPRLKAESADLDHVHFLEARHDGAPDGLVLPDDVDQIAKVVQDVGAVLVVIDPLNAHLSGSIDGHRDQDVRRALAPLHRMADELDVAVLVLAHLTKAPGNSPLNRVGGSIGIVGAARSVILLIAHPDDDGEEAFDTMNLRVVSHVKCNVGPLAGSFTYRVEPVTLHEGGRDIATSRLVFVGRTDLNADELLDPPRKKARTAVERAEAFLREHLKDGTARPSEEVKRAAMEALGVSEATVKRALPTAQILTHRTKTAQPTTTWQIAPGSQITPADPTENAEADLTIKSADLQVYPPPSDLSQLNGATYRDGELTAPPTFAELLGNPFLD